MPSKSAIATYAGWGLTALMAAALLMSAYFKLSMQAFVIEDFTGKFGYPKETLFTIGMVELGCVVLYLWPRTAILGAVLLTGYLGGAVATHVRISDGFVPPIVIGVLVWLALCLREPRLRVLLPYKID